MDPPTEKKRKIYRGIYLTGMLVLLFASTLLCILGLVHVIDIEDAPYLYLDYGITAVFWVDYLAGFFRARDKGEHFRETFIELVSILPFSPEFAVLHIFRLVRLIRIVCVFPALPHKFKRKLIRARRFLRELFNSKKVAYVLMAGTLLLITTVFVLDLTLSIPYFEALRMTAVSCFSLSAADAKVVPASWIFLFVIPFLLIYFAVATFFFAKRFRKMKKVVKKMFSAQTA